MNRATRTRVPNPFAVSTLPLLQVLHCGQHANEIGRLVEVSVVIGHLNEHFANRGGDWYMKYLRTEELLCLLVEWSKGLLIRQDHCFFSRSSLSHH